MLRFNEFSEEKVLDGDKIAIDSILNKELKVLAFSTRSSRYSKCNSGNYTIIQVELDNAKYVIFTASSVLNEQLNKYKENIPFLAKISKISSYYSFV